MYTLLGRVEVSFLVEWAVCMRMFETLYRRGSVGLALLCASSGLASAGVPLEGIKVFDPDGAFQDFFGGFVETDGEIVVVSAYSDDENGTNAGAVHLYDAQTGAFLLTLAAADAGALDSFGIASLDDGVLAVGAPGDDENGADFGAVYLFDADPSSLTFGMQLAKLMTQEGQTMTGFAAGTGVSYDNRIVAVGDWGNSINGARSGALYLFDGDPESMTFADQIAKLSPADGSGNDQMGTSVSIDGDLVVVGARLDDDNGNSSGSAYVFDVTTGMQVSKLIAADGASGDLFGSAVAIDGGLVVVGAPRAAHTGVFRSGAVYVFDATTGSQLRKITPDVLVEGDGLGGSVAINNGIVVAGAPGDGAINQRHAYLFDANNGEQIAELLEDRIEGVDDEFGGAVAIEGESVVVGARFDAGNGTTSGAAYIYDASSVIGCPADLTGDGSLNFLDVSAFLQAFGSGSLIADFTEDGSLNFLDVSAFLGAFSSGCP
jgi:FG-GAP repeat